MTASLRAEKDGNKVARVLSASLQAVDPAELVRGAIQKESDGLRIGNMLWKPTGGGRIILIGLGKAAVGMSAAALEYLNEYLVDGLIITKHAPAGLVLPIPVLEAGHPIPDERSIQVARAVEARVTSLTRNDLVICLLSGGGSALLCAPIAGLALDDIQSLTADLLSCGAEIDEINTLRRSLDRLKGGGLARLCQPAQVAALILSDVPDNALSAIASGPTVPDETPPGAALSILRKFSLERKYTRVAHSLGNAPDKPGRGDPLFDRVTNTIIGDLSIAADSAGRQAETEGFITRILDLNLRGEARKVSIDLCATLRKATSKPNPCPTCWIAGGETTVTLCPTPGRGGRNTELALAAVPHLAGLRNVLLVTLATDGEDGNAGAAGAVVTGESLGRAQAFGLDLHKYLERNDSAQFFAAMDDLLITGPTGTNVNDLVFLFAL